MQESDWISEGWKHAIERVREVGDEASEPGRKDGRKNVSDLVCRGSRKKASE